jgi:hypothetical protein
MEKWKIKLKALFDAYGPVAIGVYLSLYALVIGGIVVALWMGWEPPAVATEKAKSCSLPKELFVVAVGWAVSRITWIPRIVLTGLLTPPIAKLLGRKPVPPT